MKDRMSTNPNFFKKSIDPYVIEDPEGNNLVLSVTPYYDDGKRIGYKLDGLNCRSQPRNIIIFDNGGAINAYDKFDDLGIVGTQMYDRQKEIFAHFRVEFPILAGGYQIK